jgi:uncharacterized membrane protein (UPF0127 family)
MTYARLPIATLAVTASVMLAGCASADSSPWVQLKGKRYAVEIADDAAKRERGLMFRDDMPADHGMLFIHDAEAPQAYWMKNTKIPLDILYFDHRRKLVSEQLRVPPCSAGDRCPPFPSEGAALYVLELNAGTAEAIGAKAGDELTFGPGIGAAK